MNFRKQLAAWFHILVFSASPQTNWMFNLSETDAAFMNIWTLEAERIESFITLTLHIHCEQVTFAPKIRELNGEPLMNTNTMAAASH